MKRLNTEETKLKIIEQLIILNDDTVFEQIENLINESMQRPKPAKLTKQDIIERARLSNTDIENKDIYTINTVEKLSQRW
jgi:acetolactate synthase small subunit